MKKALAFLLLLSYMNTSMFLDSIADDEDDDTGQILYITKTAEYCLFQPVSILREKKPRERNTSQFAEYRSPKIKAVSIDIITPQPEVSHIS